MTREEDLWKCFNCGETQGRHDLWFEGDICEACFTKLNYAIIDYNMMELHLCFNEVEMVFDLTKGDIGEFWYGFEVGGKLFDVNYYKESEDTNDMVLVYNTHVDEDGEIAINTNSWYEIQIIETRGNVKNYLNNKNV
jgi:hypothetical protein